MEHDDTMVLMLDRYKVEFIRSALLMWVSSLPFEDGKRALREALNETEEEITAALRRS